MPTIRLMSDSDAPDVARLHAGTIKKGFLNKLGHRFLSEMYRGIAEDEESTVFVANLDGQVVGFCAYSRNVSTMYRKILRGRVLRLFLAALPRCLNPWIAKEIFETMRYPAKQQAMHLPAGEILSIGVSPVTQGTGVGKILIKKAIEAARNDGLREVKVLAGAQLEQANRFYQRCGFEKATEILQHGEILNVYIIGTGTAEEGKPLRAHRYRYARVDPQPTEGMGIQIACEEESERIRENWYIAPKPPVSQGWLVFSEESILRLLQGRYVQQLPAQRPPLWRLVAIVIRLLMATVQFVLMFLSVVPLVSALMEMIAVHYRRGGVGFFLRSCYWKTKLKHLGQDTLIERGIEIWGARNIEIGSCCHLDTQVRLAAGEGRWGQCGHLSIGDYCHIGPRCHIAGRGGVEIGDFVSIEAGVHVYSATNTLIHPENPGQLISFSHTAPRGFQNTIEAPVYIGDYAMVGFGSLVMPGASIGLGAIVHPGTQVVAQYPAFANITGPGRSKQNRWRRPPRTDSRLKPGSTAADAKGERT